jgi:opacity protein-like surface antigen
MNTPITLTSCFCIAASSALAGTTTGTSPSFEPAAESGWKFQTAIYGWAEGLKGDIGVHGMTAPVDIGFSDIAENLDMAFMGTFAASKGRWGFIADLTYADISAEEESARASIDFGQQQFSGNFTINYEAYGSDSFKFILYAGTRVTWIDAELKLDPANPFLPDFNAGDTRSWVDPIVGIRLLANLSPSFYGFASGDVGGFGAASDLTWQAMAGVGYRFSQQTSALLGYRAIGTDYTDGGFTYDITASGPAIGLEFKF